MYMNMHVHDTVNMYKYMTLVILHMSTKQTHSTLPLSILFSLKDLAPSWNESRLPCQPQQSQQEKRNQNEDLSTPV